MFSYDINTSASLNNCNKRKKPFEFSGLLAGLKGKLTIHSKIQVKYYNLQVNENPFTIVRGFFI